VQGIADVDLREDEARVRYRHVELNGPENGNGIQITLYDDNASITIPYWHQPEAPARARAFPTDPRPVRKDGRRATNNRKEAGKDLRLMTVHVSVRSISALLLPGIVLTPEIPLSELQKYVGHYRDAAGAAEFTILVRNQRLAVRLPNNASFDLLPPDATIPRCSSATGASTTTPSAWCAPVSSPGERSMASSLNQLVCLPCG
jgi:hypothetical protein